MAICIIYCYKFSSAGAKVGEYYIWDNEEPEVPPDIRAYGLITYNDDVIIAYDINDIFRYSFLFRRGAQNWALWERGNGHFQALARPIGGSCFYNYRYYSGRMQICKCRGSSGVLSYFTPAGSVDDLAVDVSGCVYVADGAIVGKYSETGSFIQDWRVPSGIKDLTVDKWQRVLALAQDEYTYVYSTRGVLLGSFTANYATEIYSADVGPGNQYFVMGYPTSNDNLIYVYRFTPDTTGVIPASLGKIKAIYN